MGADTKKLRRRIKSVTSTQHLTTAMGLVASSKIRRANTAMLRGREYSAALEGLVRALSASEECRRSPYMQLRGDRLRLIVIAGDRGMAGGYNANVFRFLRDYPGAKLIPIGKRACDRCGEPFVSSEHFSGADAAALAEKLCRAFLDGEVDRLGIVYTEYVSMMTQTPRLEYLLPLSRKEKTAGAGTIFEPNPETVLAQAVPSYVAGKIASAVRESFASEVAARRMAMDSAGKNAAQMIDTLTLSYNRARQSTITQEITEIVAGSGS